MEFEEFLNACRADAGRLIGIYMETETHFHAGTVMRNYDRLRADYAQYTKIMRSMPEEHRRPMTGQTPADVRTDVALATLYDGVQHQRWENETDAALMFILAFHLTERAMLENDVAPDDVLGAKLSMWMDHDDYVNAKVTLALSVEDGGGIQDGQHRSATWTRH